MEDEHFCIHQTHTHKPANSCPQGVPLKRSPAKTTPILSSQNGSHALQILTVFTGLHILHSTSEFRMHAQGYMLRAVKEEVSLVNRLGAILVLPGQFCRDS